MSPSMEIIPSLSKRSAKHSCKFYIEVCKYLVHLKFITCTVYPCMKHLSEERLQIIHAFIHSDEMLVEACTVCLASAHYPPEPIYFPKHRTEWSQRNIWTAVGPWTRSFSIAQEYCTDWEWWCLFCRDTSGQGRFCTIFRSYSRGAQVRSQMGFPVNLLHLKSKQRENVREREGGFGHCVLEELLNSSRVLKRSTQRSAVPVQTVWYVVKQGWVAAVNVTFPVVRPIHTCHNLVHNERKSSHHALCAILCTG